ncbi:craniofacial development protein 2-like [Elysia marginata]|uniref:Craniofacial development protein 2-like n=1 Tax=Elysia marginata TaxID=1093978 RepID=A0AAV4HCM1_9GAST|nr:craniofacial development protein 2-like [Elysia marginata]
MIRSLYKRTLQLQIMTRKKLNNLTMTYLKSSRETKHGRTNFWSSATSTLMSTRKKRKESPVLLDLETETTADPCYLNFVKKHHLFTTNTWFEQKESARHTWTPPSDRYLNQIDFVLCNQKYRNSIQNSKVRHGVDCGSDHKTVIITRKTRLKSMKRKIRTAN